MSGDLPHFKEPPINEVAMGVRFAPIEGLVPVHFGLFWSSLRKEFSETVEAAPLTTSEGLALNKMGLPISRFWLIGTDKQYLIQLQPNIFYFNWRRQNETRNYPRYSTIKPLFDRYLRHYFDFLSQERLQVPSVVNCDLTYVNIIPQDDNVVANYDLFPDLSWRQEKNRFLAAPKAVNWQATFDVLDGAAELTAKIHSAKRILDNVPVLQFELNTRDLRAKPLFDETEQWFDRAHEIIVLSFADLTSDEAQWKIWKRVNADTSH